MAFSCGYLLSKLRQDKMDENPKREKPNRKRTCPFPSFKDEDFKDDNIIPEAVDVLESIFSSMCSFTDSRVTKTKDDIKTVSELSEVKVANEIFDIISDDGGSVANENITNETETTQNEDDMYDFSNIPMQITGSWKEFVKGKDNYTRGCKWAPDGSCVLSCSNDNILRIFNMPAHLWDMSQWADISEMEAVLKIPEGEIIYDYCWYPLMNSADSASSCLISSSKNNPVHLWDAFTGELRCTYRSYNQMDEIAAANSLSFDASGQRIFCGFEKTIRIFNVDLPGRKFDERHTFTKKSGQSGIISCFAFTSANPNISVVGSYRKSIGIYSEPDGNLECILDGQKGGVTQLQFSPDGNLLYSGGRKDPEILCWDMRNFGQVLYSLRRSVLTNQRMYFDITRCGRYVISGNSNGVISIWDTLKEPKVLSQDDIDVLEPAQFYMAHGDCINGISINPHYPLLCSSSGQRQFQDLLPDEEDKIFAPEIETYDNSLRIWWIGKSIA